MTSLFYVILSLVLIILQTSLLPGLPFFYQSFDLLLVVVLSLSLRSAHPAACIGVIFLGCIMDSVSGGPFGLYLSSYVWIYIAVQMFKGVVHSENIVFLYVSSIVAVMIENGIALFSLAVQQGSEVFLSPDISFMGHQVLWTLFLMPVMIIVVELFHRWFLVMIKMFVRKSREFYS